MRELVDASSQAHVCERKFIPPSATKDLWCGVLYYWVEARGACSRMIERNDFVVHDVAALAAAKHIGELDSYCYAEGTKFFYSQNKFY